MSNAASQATAAKQAAKQYANALGHKMGRWDTDGMSECQHCGAVLVDTDALDFVQHSSVTALGSLSAPCPHQ